MAGTCVVHDSNAFGRKYTAELHNRRTTCNAPAGARMRTHARMRAASPSNPSHPPPADPHSQADVFSFGICLYEMLHRTLLLLTILQKETAKNPRASFSDKEAAIMEYVQAVAAGYRPPLSRHLPPELAELLTRCWSSNPLERPSMRSVYDTLTELAKHPEALAALDVDPNAPGCCVVS
jgi:serine/threonine protein kinase